MITRARLKEFRSLATRQGRREQGAFLAEGVRVLEEARRHGQAPRLVLYCEQDLRERERVLVEDWRRQGVDCEAIPSQDLARVADARTPQNVLADMPLPATDLPSALAVPRVVVLDGIQDPGNVGTLLRSALAFGFRQVVMSGAAADPYGPKVVRSSAGALFGLQVLQEESADTLVSWVRSQELPLLVASAHEAIATQTLPSLLGGDRLAVVIGSEAEGCAPAWERAADLCWRIPHEDAVESLNAAVAGSILLQQAYAAAREGAR